MFQVASTNSLSTSAPAGEPELVTVRNATAADARALRRLAALDDRRLPAGPHLVAEVGGEIVAAVGVRARQVVADPFRRTADLVALLDLRASQLAQAPEPAPPRAQPHAIQPATA